MVKIGDVFIACLILNKQKCTPSIYLKSLMFYGGFIFSPIQLFLYIPFKLSGKLHPSGSPGFLCGHL